MLIKDHKFKVLELPKNYQDDDKLEIIAKSLQSISDDIGKWTNLKFLSITANNKLEKISPEIFKLPNLQFLKLKNVNFPEDFEITPEAPALEKLILNSCSLMHAPDFISKFRSLKELSLIDNQIIDLPDSYNNLRELYRIDLDNNNITTIPVVLHNLTNLDHISLDKNPISKNEKKKALELFSINIE